MSYRLFICEKPSQAGDLARNLGIRKKLQGYWQDGTGGTLVTWCLGHLLTEFMPDDYDPAYKKWNLSDLPIIPEKWRFQVASKTKDQYRVVSGLVKGASEVVIATDFDREGEAIARNILNRTGFKGSLSRLCLTALDDASIQKALRKIVPGSETEPLYRAALGRSRADWLVGLNLTRFYTLKMQKSGSALGVVSVGRVISPTVKLVVDRDLAIENFQPVTFYEILADMAAGSMSYKARWLPPESIQDPDGHVLDRQYPEAVIAKCRGQKARVLSFERRDKKEYPPLPFDLTSLQQHCSKRWGYSAQKTLSLAQSLYEKHKATTYPRTDTRYLPDEQFREVPDIFRALAAQDPGIAEILRGANISRKPACYKTAKVTAHNAIVPTGNPAVNPAAMTAEERNVFGAIRRAFIAQFYPPAVYDSAVMVLECLSEKFKAASKLLKTPGWKVLYESESRDRNDGAGGTGSPDSQENRNVSEKQGRDNDDTAALGLPPQRLPDARPGDLHDIRDLTLEEKETTPPKHFTEATLLAAMENIARFVTDPSWKKMLKDTDGLGTPATRAGIIDSALKWEYLVREGRNTLLSTPKSRYLMTGVLSEDLTSPGLTAQWEQRLEKIAGGYAGESEESFEKDIAAFVTEIIEKEMNRAFPEAPAMTVSPRRERSGSGNTGGSRKRSGTAASGTGTRRTRTGKTGGKIRDNAPEPAPESTETGTASRTKTRTSGRRKSSGTGTGTGTRTGVSSFPENRNHPESPASRYRFSGNTPEPPREYYPGTSRGFSEPGDYPPDFPPYTESRSVPPAPPEDLFAPAGYPEDRIQNSPDHGGFMYDPEQNPYSHTYKAVKGRSSGTGRKSGTGKSTGKTAQTASSGDFPEGFPPFPESGAGFPGQLPPEFYQSAEDMNSIFNDMSFGPQFGEPVPPQETARDIPVAAPAPRAPEPGMTAGTQPRRAANSAPYSSAASGTPFSGKYQRPAPVPADGDPPSCPKCGTVMVLRTGIRGSFWSCPRYPECRSTIDASGEGTGKTTAPASRGASGGSGQGNPGATGAVRKTAPADTGEDVPVCPSCGDPMKKRQGPRGPFWGCSNFPKCRGTRNI